ASAPATAGRAGYRSAGSGCRGIGSSSKPAADAQACSWPVSTWRERSMSSIWRMRRIGIKTLGMSKVCAWAPEAQAEHPVAEEVAALLLDRHAGGVVRRLRVADLQPHAQLPRREHHVDAVVEVVEGDEPKDEQDGRDQQVAAHVDADVEHGEIAHQPVPEVEVVQDQPEGDEDQDDDERPEAAQRHV